MILFRQGIWRALSMRVSSKENIFESAPLQSTNQARELGHTTLHGQDEAGWPEKQAFRLRKHADAGTNPRHVSLSHQERLWQFGKLAHEVNKLD